MRLALAVLVLAAGLAAAHLGAGPEVHVVLEDGRPVFDPVELNVVPGQTVLWEDTTGAAHTVTSLASLRGAPDGRVDGALAPNGTFDLVIAEAGDLAYACRLHPWMTGIVHALASVPGAGALAVVALTAAAARGVRPRARP